MPKSWRNTLFTIIILGLVSLGLNWNKDVINDNHPVAVTSDVLAAQITSNFPLDIILSVEPAHLGQNNNVHIHTLANSKLEILTVLPTGKNETREATADNDGNYEFTFVSSDFHNVGQVKLIVLAKNGTGTNEAQHNFELEP